MTHHIRLRDVVESDLPIFFQQQLDPVANAMAAFTAQDPTDRTAFDARWTRVLADPAITVKTILFDDQIAGHIVCHSWFGPPEISYWIGRDHWGKGIATAALAQLLVYVKTRPLYARAAKDNVGSIRVLERNGFTISGTGTGYANARGEEVEELILLLAVPADAGATSASPATS